MVYFIIWYLIGIASSLYLCKTEQGSIKVRDIFIILLFAFCGIIIPIVFIYIKKKDDIENFFDKDIY
jgi:hypothetical protein